MYILYKSLSGRKAPSNFMGTYGDQRQGERLQTTLWVPMGDQRHGRKAPDDITHIKANKIWKQQNVKGQTKQIKTNILPTELKGYFACTKLKYIYER